MTVAFSFCHHDKPQAVRLAQRIRQLGGVEKHDCLIIFPNVTDAEGIEESLRQAFRYVEVLSYAAQLDGWPQGANEAHARTAFALVNHPKFQGAWLYMEPDCVPTTSHWLDHLASVHQRSGRPMLGTLNNTIETASGRVIGRHVVGVAIYPQDFSRVCPLVKNVIRTSAEYVRQRQMPPAFDCYYEAYTVPMTHVSPLIQHLWRTDSYREENGRIVCNFRTPYPGAPAAVDPEAVLLHGCKDSSLLDLLQARGSQAPASIPTPRRAAPPEAAPKPAAPAPVAPITEAELDAPPAGSPVMPPFPKGSPEQRRFAELMEGKWTKTMKYAARVLKIKCYGIQRVPLVNAIVLKEREIGKEEWTKELNKPVLPPPPLEPVREWKAGDGAGAPISDVTQQRMMQLRQKQVA